jgi:hypothetical protein
MTTDTASANLKVGTVEWYEHWIGLGCVAFYPDGRPKRFDSDYSDYPPWPKPDDPGLHANLLD